MVCMFTSPDSNMRRVWNKFESVCEPGLHARVYVLSSFKILLNTLKCLQASGHVGMKWTFFIPLVK